MRLRLKLIIGLFMFFNINAQAQTANFSVHATSSATGCAPHTVRFLNQSSNATSYLWEFGFSGPGGTSTLQDPSTVYYTPGQYTVKLTAYNGSSSNTITKTYYVTVHDTPKVDFTAAPVTNCIPFNVNFNNQTVPNGSSATYVWVFQGATPGTSTATSPGSINYTLAGVHNVTLKATNNHNCVSTRTKVGYINAKPLPQVTFTGSPLTFCGSSGLVNFTSTITGVPPSTYQWSFGGTTANPTGVSFTSPPASHNVKLVVTGTNGCKDSLVRTGYVNFTNTGANFTAPASVCVGTPVNFVNTTTPCITTAKWYFDYPTAGGDSSTDLNPIYAYGAPGTKTVKMITFCGPCPDTVTKTIVVHALPVVDFTTKPDSPCPAPMAIQYIPNANYSNYLWDFGYLASTGPASSTSASPIRTYTANGFDTVMLTAKDANGCESFKVKAPSVKIFDLHAKILADSASNYGSGCAPLTVTFTGYVYTLMRPTDGLVYPPETYSYPYGVKTYHWKFGDGTESFLKDPVKTYTDSGKFKVVLRVVTNNNCVTADSFIVEVGVKPLASFMSPAHVCFNHDLVFLNTTVTPPPYNKSKWWWVGDSTTFDGTKVTIGQNGEYKYVDPLNPGPYCVRLVNYHNGCPSDTFMKCIDVDSPKAMYVKYTFCHKDSLRIVRFQSKSVGATTWKWFFGDGNTSTTATDTFYKYAVAGTYTAILVAYNATSACIDTYKTTIRIIDASLSLVADDTAICKDQWVHFTASLTGSVANTYTWNIGGVITSTLINVFDSSFSDTGRYRITVETADENGCPHFVEKNKWIFVSKPYVNFNPNPPFGCTPLTINFTDASKLPFGATTSNRLWTFGGSTPPVVSNNNVNTQAIFPTAGTHTIKLVVTDNLGCRDSLEKTINAYKPIATFATKDTGCLNQQHTFFNNSVDIVKSFWMFGDGDTSTFSQPGHTYTQLGVYPVTLIVEDQYGCKDTAKKMPGVAITKPNAAFTVTPDSVGVCIPLIANFVNNTTGPNSAAYTYLWNLGNGSSAVPNPANAYTTPGIYRVTLIATTPHGCVDSVSSNVRLYGFSGSLAYTPTLGCVPLEVDFTPVGLFNIPTITWDFTDGNVTATSLLDPIKHTYTKSGVYLPKLILQDMNGCKTVSTGLDTIKVDESFADFTNGPACEYQDMDFFDNSTGLFSNITSWIWAFDTSSTFSFIKNPKHLYGPPGQYNVRLIVTSANQCKDTIDKLVTINPLPDIDAGADTIICLTDSATLMPAGGVSYLWSPKLYLSCDTCTNPMAGVPKRFTYTVIGTDANGCKNKDTVTVDIKTKVKAFVGPGGEICDKDTFGLYAWGAHHYEWKPAESLNDAKIPNPIASPYQNTNYIVVAYEGRCIPDTHAVNIIVHPLPDVKAEGTATVVAGNTADLRASGSLIRRFEWSPAEDLSCTDCAFPTARPSQTTTYKVIVYSEHQCVDSDRVTITVLCDKSQLFIPNTFTPNGDGQNDVFYPRGAGMDKVQSFRIYNRWGEVVYQKTSFDLNDQNTGWDGSFKGNQLPPDVFVWVLDAICDDGKILTLKGDVTIIR